MKKVVRLTEGDLHRIVKESVQKVIKEWGEYVPDPSDYLNDEPLNRWYREHPGIDPPEDMDDYNEEDYMFDDSDSAWDDRWEREHNNNF